MLTKGWQALHLPPLVAPFVVPEGQCLLVLPPRGRKHIPNEGPLHCLVSLSRMVRNFLLLPFSLHSAQTSLSQNGLPHLLRWVLTSSLSTLSLCFSSEPLVVLKLLTCLLIPWDINSMRAKRLCLFLLTIASELLTWFRGSIEMHLMDSEKTVQFPLADVFHRKQKGAHK